MSEAEILWEDVSREAGLTRGERERLARALEADDGLGDEFKRLAMGEAIVIEAESRGMAGRVRLWSPEAE